MKTSEAIQTALKSTQFLLTSYVSDLTDADLLVRPVEGANHIAWQLGHLLVSEKYLVTKQIADAPYPELPVGFAEQHTNDTAAMDPPTGFATKEIYLDLFNKVREATIQLVGGLSDADFDRPTNGEMAKFAPTLGAVLVLVSNHTLMHGGQITVVRRKLGKPVLF